jgi:hypothetical protein
MVCPILADFLLQKFNNADVFDLQFNEFLQNDRQVSVNKKIFFCDNLQIEKCSGENVLCIWILLLPKHHAVL